MELECKLAVESHDPTRAALRAAAAAYGGRVLEENRLLDRADGSLRASGCGLRVRRIQALDGQSVEAGSVTFKGPPRDSAYKLREEIETAVADPGAMAGLLRAIGLTETIVFEKRRETWRLGECMVDLDELPKLGRFVEIEGPSEAAIHDAIARLGLTGATEIRENYAALIARAVGGGGGVIELRF